jgi:hypothetical protein
MKGLLALSVVRENNEKRLKQVNTECSLLYPEMIKKMKGTQFAGK